MHYMFTSANVHLQNEWCPVCSSKNWVGMEHQSMLKSLTICQPVWHTRKHHCFTQKFRGLSHKIESTWQLFRYPLSICSGNGTKDVFTLRFRINQNTKDAFQSAPKCKFINDLIQYVCKNHKGCVAMNAQFGCEWACGILWMVDVTQRKAVNIEQAGKDCKRLHYMRNGHLWHAYIINERPWRNLAEEEQRSILWK